MSSSLGALTERAVDVFTDAIDQAIEARSHCYCALSRPTPEQVFRAIGDRPVPRKRVDVFQVDERAAKSESDDRNYKLIKDYMKGWTKNATMRPIKINDDSGMRWPARKYEKLLTETLGSPPVFDFIHLGLGPDGHTASLVPNDPVLDEQEKFVSASKKVAGYRRLTLTYPVLNAARLILFIVSGREKAEALRGVLSGDESVPAARITNANVRFFVDSDAAALL